MSKQTTISETNAAHLAHCVKNFDALVDALDFMLDLRAATLRAAELPEHLEMVAAANRVLAAARGAN